MAGRERVNRVVIVASHRRSGTHLALDSLRVNALDLDPRFMTLERIEPRHPKHLPVGEFDRRLRSRSGTVLVKTHALPGRASWESGEAGAYAERLLEAWPSVYVHRDGRDVLVSLYHFIGSYSPNVTAQSFAEFIRAESSASDAVGISRAAYWQQHILQWLDHNPEATASFERMKADFPGAMADLASHLGLALRPSLSPVRLDERYGPGPKWQHRLRRGLSRFGITSPARSTAIRPRSGSSGGWRAQFDAADLAWFETQAGEAMRRLGYVDQGLPGPEPAS